MRKKNSSNEIYWNSETDYTNKKEESNINRSWKRNIQLATIGLINNYIHNSIFWKIAIKYSKTGITRIF